MLLFGVISSIIGLLVMWQLSLVIGGPIFAVGAFVVYREYSKNDAPPSSGRDYSSEAPSYDISSKPRR